ncbi:hypothetical protein GCM10027564_02670 [Luteimonas notoginsengisoli]
MRHWKVPDALRGDADRRSPRECAMSEHAHPIQTMGGYQLVALTTGETYDPRDVIAFVVMTMSGARLHYEHTLEDARAWLERLVAEDVASPRKLRPRSRKARTPR